MNDELTIAGKRFGSRLILGTGKYASPELCSMHVTREIQRTTGLGEIPIEVKAK